LFIFFLVEFVEAEEREGDPQDDQQNRDAEAEEDNSNMSYTNMMLSYSDPSNLPWGYAGNLVFIFCK